jgi:DNA-binding transcriptional LysR family regulator
MRRVIEPEELINEPLIVRESTSGTRRMMLSQMAKFDIGIDDLNIFMELGSAEAIVRTVATGYAVSFVSTLASACPLERGNVVDVQVNGFEMRRKIYMIRKRLDAHQRAQEVFWGFVHSPTNVDILKQASQKKDNGEKE